MKIFIVTSITLKDPFKFYKMNRLTIKDFAGLFGTSQNALPNEAVKIIQQCNWDYQIISGNNRDSIIIDLLTRIESRKLSRVENEDLTRWETGWGENLDEFIKSGGNLLSLIPKYIRSGQPLRLNGEFILPQNPNFEYDWYRVFREWFFRTCLSGYDHIYEFGSGSGFNIAELSKLFPNAKIHGLDWAKPSVEICERLRTDCGLNVEGHLFNFFAPDYSINFPANSVVFTIGALEQTGLKWQPFFDFIQSKKPKACFHIEPVYEFYENIGLVDYTAKKIHEHRNFWRGFPSILDEMVNIGKAKVLKQKRSNFGSLVLEGYSQIFWEPLL